MCAVPARGLAVWTAETKPDRAGRHARNRASAGTAYCVPIVSAGMHVYAAGIAMAIRLAECVPASGFAWPIMLPGHAKTSITSTAGERHVALEHNPASPS